MRYMRELEDTSKSTAEMAVLASTQSPFQKNGRIVDGRTDRELVSGRSTAKTKLVGPIKPGETSYTEFENAWYNSVGTCAEIRGTVVEHIDGGSFTYINDLKDIAREAENVRLIGDCSYKAQQKRKN